jgi:hypothetical protein
LPRSRRIDWQSSGTTSFAHRQPLRAAQTSQSIAFGTQEFYGEDRKQRRTRRFGIHSRQAPAVWHLKSCQKIQKSQPVKKVRDKLLQQLNRMSGSPST